MKKEQPLVSIIIPVYNIENCIEYCLDSVRNQTYQNLEIIIIDDGSVDKTGQICDNYAENDNRIKVIHRENAGQANARNHGIDIALGQYISFIDGDDWVSEDYIEYLYNLLIEYDAQVSNCEFIRKHTFGDCTVEACEKKILEFDSQSAIENLCYMKELNCAPYSKLFCREIFENIRFPEGYIYEDMAIIYKTYHEADKIVYGNKKGYFYYQREGSSMRTDFSPKKLSRVKFSDEIFEFVEEKYPTIVKSAYNRKFWSNAGALMDMPRDYDKEVRNQVKANIKATRTVVLMDASAKWYVRAMALSSFLGMELLKMLSELYKVFIKK